MGVCHPKEGCGVQHISSVSGSSDLRPYKEKWQRVSAKNETASNTGSNDSRPVPPRGSVAAMASCSRPWVALFVVLACSRNSHFHNHPNAG